MDDFLAKQAEEAEDAGDMNTAFELWKQLAAGNREEYFLLSYARVAKEVEKWQEAEDALTQAFRLAPNSPLVMQSFGTLWLSRTDKNADDSLPTAKHWFLQALKHERTACVLTLLGATYCGLNDEPAARDAFEEAIKIDPDYEEALYNLAVLDENKKPERSIELLEKAIQIDPDYLLAHQILGRLAHKKDLLCAEYHFQRCLEIDPADYWSNLYMANLLGVQGRNDEAEQTYAFATNLHPELTGGMEIFARFLESIGKAEEAANVRARGKSYELNKPGESV
ncbi:MAG TPA: tetratricopeptide repeat protein [Candidatus Angelobacter sp.]|nr:tetratricopeptide repeat protein [Candidatus Angelobacter sp.]